MSEFLVAEMHQNLNRPWRQRRQQGIHTAVNFVRFVEAKNKEDAVKKLALRDTFLLNHPKTYMVLSMRNVTFIEAATPIINLKQGSPR